MLPARSDGRESTPRPPSLRAHRSRCVAFGRTADLPEEHPEDGNVAIAFRQNTAIMTSDSILCLPRAVRARVSTSPANLSTAL